MGELEGHLKEVRHYTLTKNVKAQIASAQATVQAILELVDAKAQLEKEHARKLLELHTLMKQRQTAVSELRMSGLSGLLEGMVQQTKDQADAHMKLFTGLIGEVIEPLTKSLSKNRAVSQFLLTDVRSEENELTVMDKGIDTARLKAEEAGKRTKMDPQEIKANLSLRRRASVDVMVAKTSMEISGCFDHNMYCMTLEATNAHRAHFWMHELPLMMDQLEDYQKEMLLAVKTYSEVYAGMSKEAYTIIPQTFVDLAAAVDSLAPGNQISESVKWIASTGPDVVPFKQPGDRKYDSPDGYPCCLAVTDYSFYGLQHQHRRLQAEWTVAKNAQQRLASELAAVEKLETLYTQNPNMGDPTQLPLNALSVHKSSRAVRLKEVRTRANMDLLEAAGCEKAGGFHSLSSTSKQCKACKVTVHEGKCEALNWKPCTKDSQQWISAVENARNLAQAQAQRGQRLYAVGDNTAAYESMPLATSSAIDDEFAEPAGSVQQPVTGPASVLYTYEAQNDDEVGATEGDTVEVLGVDGDWATVKVGDRQGIFPQSYLSIGPTADTLPLDEPAKTGPPVAADAPGIKIVKMLFTHTPAEPDELEVKEGDEVEVLAYEEGGWTYGRIKDTVGYFPTSYADDQQQPNAESGELNKEGDEPNKEIDASGAAAEAGADAGGDQSSAS